MSKNAVEWHTAIATDFDAGYGRSDNFKERFSMFSGLIRKYGGANKQVIDLGCGAGIFSLYAAPLNRHVTGVDGSEAMIAIGKGKIGKANIKNVEFIVRDITTLTRAEVSAADLVICSSVLEYIDDVEKSCAIIEALLNTAGVLIVSMPNKSSIYRKLENLFFRLTKKPAYYRFVKNVISAEEMSRLLERKGLAVIETHYFSRMPFLPKWFATDIFRQWTNNLFVIVARKVE